MKERWRAYREKHREVLRARRRAYIAKYPERIKAYDNTPEARVRRMVNYRKRQYGVSDAQFNKMVAAQVGKCGICTQPMKPPHIDHDHKTKVVRGLLCGKCNKAIGLFNEDIKLLDAAREYLAFNASGIFTLA